MRHFTKFIHRDRFYTKRKLDAKKAQKIFQKYKRMDEIGHILPGKLRGKHGQNFHLDDKEANTVIYSMHTLSESKGLYGYLFRPNQTNYPSKPVVHIAFRGTKDKDSFKRDLEPHGPGAVSFANAQQTIIDNIVAQLNQLPPQPYSIAVGGHSLGGADAQHCLVALMEHIDQNPTHFENLTKLKLYTFHSPGVPHTIQKKASHLARELKKKHPLKISKHILQIHGDPVPQGGEAQIFSDLIHDKDAPVKINLFQAHPTIPYRKYILLALFLAFIASIILLIVKLIIIALAILLLSSIGIIITLVNIMHSHKMHLFHDDKQKTIYEYYSTHNPDEPEIDQKHKDYIHETLQFKSWGIRPIQSILNYFGRSAKQSTPTQHTEENTPQASKSNLN